MCPHTIYVSSYYYVCPHTAICVLILLIICALLHRSRDRKSKKDKKEKKRAKTNDELRGDRPEYDEFGRLIDYTRKKKKFQPLLY